MDSDSIGGDYADPGRKPGKARHSKTRGSYHPGPIQADGKSISWTWIRDREEERRERMPPVVVIAERREHRAFERGFEPPLYVASRGGSASCSTASRRSQFRSFDVTVISRYSPNSIGKYRATSRGSEWACTAFRDSSLDYAELPGGCWIPAPLPPPARPRQTFSAGPPAPAARLR